MEEELGDALPAAMPVTHRAVVESAARVVEPASGFRLSGLFKKRKI
jgi:hypothetical protein